MCVIDVSKAQSQNHLIERSPPWSAKQGIGPNKGLTEGHERSIPQNIYPMSNSMSNDFSNADSRIYVIGPIADQAVVKHVAKTLVSMGMLNAKPMTLAANTIDPFDLMQVALLAVSAADCVALTPRWIECPHARLLARHGRLLGKKVITLDLTTFAAMESVNAQR